MLEVRKFKVLRIIPLLNTIFSLSFPACAKYASGRGTTDADNIAFSGHVKKEDTCINNVAQFSKY
jgi:hypothetical protein